MRTSHWEEGLELFPKVQVFLEDDGKSDGHIVVEDDFFPNFLYQSEQVLIPRVDSSHETHNMLTMV